MHADTDTCTQTHARTHTRTQRHIHTYIHTHHTQRTNTTQTKPHAHTNTRTSSQTLPTDVTKYTTYTHTHTHNTAYRQTDRYTRRATHEEKQNEPEDVSAASHDLFARLAVPDASGGATHAVLAAESAGVLCVLGDFDLRAHCLGTEKFATKRTFLICFLKEAP